MVINKNKKVILASAFVFAIVLTGSIVLSGRGYNFLRGKNIKIENDAGSDNAELTNTDKESDSEGEISESEEIKEKSPISGVACDNAKRRPFAVMLAGDLEAWPLSGIGEADLVVEMPVVTDGITRYMAIYVCNNPEEIGSVRSARHDFIPLAMGFDAIFAHWGGSHFALDKLNSEIMDNVNALYLDGSVFYRKAGLPKPHDGFTTIERMEDYSKRIAYRLENKFEGYNFYKEENPIDKNGKINIGYPSVYKVDYEYKSKTNSYLRFKGDKKDKDKLTSKQIEAKNVVIMFAASRQIEGQYNDVDIEGEGEIIVYQNGWEIKGKWKKDKGDLKSKLYFYNESGEEIKFVPGQIWIQVVEPDREVRWEIVN